MTDKLGNFQFGTGVDPYNMTDWEETFTRTYGRYGNEGVFNLMGSDYFFGEVLNGGWERRGDGSIYGAGASANHHTAKVDGSGNLDILGRAAVAANADYGWVTYEKGKIWLYPGTVIDIHLYLPSHSSANSFAIHFYLTRESPPNNGTPEQDDALDFELYTDTTTYYTRVRKRVDTTWTDLSDVEGDGYDPRTNQQGTFRLRVHLDGTMSGYYHDGTGDVVEPSDLLEFFNREDLQLNFDVAYASIGIVTAEATNRTVSSSQLVITYPRCIQAKFDRAIADIQDGGDIRCWDTNLVAGEANWDKVRDANHDFNGELICENGIIRVWINNHASGGLNFYHWNGSDHVHIANSFELVLDRSSQSCKYPDFLGLKYLSRDRVDFEVRFHEDATDDEDFYIDAIFTMHRNQPYLLCTITAVYPSQRFYPLWYDAAAKHRFGYAGNAETEGVGDDDLGVSGVNDTLDENYTMGWDPDTDAWFFFIAVNRKPENGASNGWLDANDGSGLGSKYHTMNQRPKFMFGVVPFSLISSVFGECENGTLIGGATTGAGLGDDSGDSVVCDANSEGFSQTLNTNLPAGKYLYLIRAKDSDSTNYNELNLRVQRVDSWEYIDDDKTSRTVTPVSTWTYFQMVFTITDDMVGSTSAYVYAAKNAANVNTIYLDYFLIVPISNGEDWVQDLAQALLRQRDQWYKGGKLRVV